MNLATINFGIKTFYKFYAVNIKTGKERELSGWSGNILLTNGRNELPKQTSWFNSCQLGRSSLPPTDTQTAMQDYITGSSQIEDVVNGAASTPPYYGYKRHRFRFLDTSGIAGENINEVGIGWNTAAGDYLVTRALIENLAGAQTTITPLAGEYLDVLVEVRYYPPLVDVTGTVTLNGLIYDYIIRASNVTSTTKWGTLIGAKIAALTSSGWTAYDDDISTIDVGPSGVATACGNFNYYTEAYSENSYQVTMGAIAGPGVINTNGWYITTGKLCRSITIQTSAGEYKVQFDSQTNPGFGVPKTDNETFTLQVILGWQPANPMFSGTVATQSWSTGVPVSLAISGYFQSILPEPIVYTIESGALPSGLSLNASTGLIDGTPDTVSTGTLQITCTNDVGHDSTNVFNWAVT